MKTIFFAHSAGPQGGPGEGSYDWIQSLRRDLGAEWAIRFPVVENPDAPDYGLWENMLREEFRRCPDGIILLGHSLGGSMLLKYLSEQRVPMTIRALISVSAPWWGPEGWDVESFALRPDFASRLPAIAEVHFYHAKRDPVVPFGHLAIYEREFPGLRAHALPRKDHAFARGLPEVSVLLKTLG